MSELGEELIEGMKQAVAYARGDANDDDYRVTRVEVETPDVKAMRDRMEMTQQEFADFLGISVHTLGKWERGERRPEGAARVLLTIVEHEPEAVLRALHENNNRPDAR